MKKRGLWVLSGLLCLVLVSLLACTPAATTTPSPTSKATLAPTSAPVSFAGKTVTMILVTSIGGSSDIIARIFAMYLSRLLPGNPAVVVRAMPGGSSTIGSNYVYSTAKPDGLTILIGSTGVQLNQMIDMSSVHYDLLKMPLLIGGGTAAVVYAKPSIISRPEDILKAKGLICGSSSAGFAYLFIIAKELLNIPVEKVALGYSGSGETRRALLSGEINMSVEGGPAYVETLTEYVKKGEIIPLFQTGLPDEKGNLVRGSGLPPDILTVNELYEKLYGKSPSGIVWDAYKALAAVRQYNYPLYLPPRTPDNIVRAYWGACEAMLKDSEFRKIADSMGGTGTRWGAGEAFDKDFKLNFALDPKVREWIRTTMAKYGVVV